MVFSSLTFLYLFLPLVLLVYFISPRPFKNIVLLLASLFFYAWGEPKLVVLMIVSIVFNYLFGLLIDRSVSVTKKKLWVAAAVFTNLAILGYYKYAGFFIDVIEDWLSISIPFEEVPLPIGISFYTFQAISYIMDVYRKKSEAQKSLINLALYISLFPQLIAGPIVRYQTIADQITYRIVTLGKVEEGVKKFVQGLAKKVLIANPMGEVADQVFATSGGDLTTATAWIGIIAYALQIYFDFSGYSDMAIGLGKVFGFDFEKNFNYPYISQSVSEFWRRWHISLGNWFRDYVYIPLGGNRVAEWKVYRNLLIVWTLTGFWHGATWSFMFWGFYFAVFICLEKWFMSDMLKKFPRPFRHIYLLTVVTLGWVFFRAENFQYAFDFFSALFHLNGNALYDGNSVLYIYDYWLFFVIAVILAMPVYKYLIKFIDQRTTRPFTIEAFKTTASVYYLLLLIIVTMYLVNETHNPFIYFRF